MHNSQHKKQAKRGTKENVRERAFNRQLFVSFVEGRPEHSRIGSALLETGLRTIVYYFEGVASSAGAAAASSGAAASSDETPQKERFAPHQLGIDEFYRVLRLGGLYAVADELTMYILVKGFY